MRMIVDVILAVAVVALALGAVPEFQLRVRHIRPAADRALVGVGSLGGGVAGFVGTGVELDDLCPSCGLGLFPEQPGSVGTPAHRNYVQHVLPKEQEVVCKRYHREQIVGEGIGYQADDHEYQIDKSENPGLHGNDEEQQENTGTEVTKDRRSGRKAVMTTGQGENKDAVD